MDLVYIRLIAYALSMLAGMIPAAWAGWASYDAVAGTVTVSIEGLAAAAGAGLAMSVGIFKRWGR
ncbi:hypothetical protein [Gemmobacter denitrificans]|uniref:Uncharacterized protein n=1 Tax=Gemmobacter denitrificans TaxID=3123040 RepID=A0ABU8BS64_9RHOB